MNFKYTSEYFHDEHLEADYQLFNRSYSDKSNGTSLSVSTDSIYKYESNDITQGSLSEIKTYMIANVDSLIKFDSIFIDDEIVGYFATYWEQNQNYITSEATYNYGDYSTSLVLYQPIGIDTNYAKDIFDNVKLPRRKNTFYNSSKSTVLLQDLISTDTTIFQTARANLQNYNDFNQSDSSLIIETLCKKMYDDKDSSTAKYMLVSDFNNLNYTFEQFQQVYNCQSTPRVKARLLNSLSRQELPNAIDNLMSTLEKESETLTIEPSTFDIFLEDFDQFYKHYESLLSLANQGVCTEYILHIIISWNLAEYDLEKLAVHRKLFDGKISELIDKYYKEAKKDTSASVSSTIMDYLLLVDGHPDEMILYDYLQSSNDIYGKYKTAYNLNKKSKEISSELIADIATTPYYLYWLTEILYESNSTELLPDKYKSTKHQAEAVTISLLYDNLGVYCDSCELVKELKVEIDGKEDSMSFVRCKYDESEFSYVGFAGPFNESGVLDIDNSRSMYWDTPITKLEFEEVIEKFKQHLLSSD